MADSGDKMAANRQPCDTIINAKCFENLKHFLFITCYQNNSKNSFILLNVNDGCLFFRRTNSFKYVLTKLLVAMLIRLLQFTLTLKLNMMRVKKIFSKWFFYNKHHQRLYNNLKLDIETDFVIFQSRRVIGNNRTLKSANIRGYRITSSA